MMSTGIPGRVQISRNVYELIFSLGFHVVEKGDTEIGENETIATYLVNSIN